MLDLIVLGGAPGSGKSTVAQYLRDHFQSPMIDFGWLREWHLDPAWQRANPHEEQMAFENLMFVVHNYRKYGYTRVIVHDLQEQRLHHIPRLCATLCYTIFTLVLTDDAVLRARLGSRQQGFRHVERALAWNQAVRVRPTLPHEYKVDTTIEQPVTVCEKIIRHIQLLEAQRDK